MPERNLLNIDLNLLVPLQALLRERNVTRAAAQVGLSQPAMSSALKRLRAVLGDELLVRTKSGYQLSYRAEAIRDAVDAALTMIGTDILDISPFDADSSTRRFRVGASSATVYAAMRPVITRAAALKREISFSFVDVTRTADAMLEELDLDLILLPDVLPTEHPRERLYDESWVFVVSADNPMIGDRLTVDDLEAHPYAVFESSGLRTHAELALAALGRPGHAMVLSADFMSLLHLVPGTGLVACVQGTIARELAPRLGLRIVAPPTPLPAFGIDMVWNPRRVADQSLAWLRDELRTSWPRPDGASSGGQST